ncbi:Hypothetical predicted protein, partial [Mytilus galloprovincialis]
MSRIANGSISVVGKVGQCQPPYLVMPITIEPSKPRMCHDERFLNLWIKDHPFTLDTLKDVPRVISENSYLSSLDDKSGYDHILLHPHSKMYFGLQFGGWFMVYNSIPFGFKASAFIYHTTGLVAMSYCRSLGVPGLLYIDDRLVPEWKGDSTDKADPYYLALKGLYIVCQVLVRLGYFLNLTKCVLTPTKCLKFLGMLCDSRKMAFILPQEKKISFSELKEKILANDEVALKTLQRFAGKCISFVLAIPGSRLYSREVNRAVGIAFKNSRPIKIYNELRAEISMWRFLDNWTGCAPWRDEKHLQVVLASDATPYKWGSFLVHQGKTKEFGDFWIQGQNSEEAIHVKEAFALLNTLKSVQSQLMDHRVDAFCDNMAVVKAWENQGGRDPSLNAVLKDIFYFTHEFNISLHVHFIASADNPADKESRRMSKADAKLSDEYWRFVEDKFGPHSIDLMALDSNVMLDSNGQPLKHFTPFPCKSSSGWKKGDKWYDATSGGNPACSLEVKNYLKAIQLEQAKSHVQQKQAKPLFLGKLKSVCEYLDARLQNPSLSLAEKYVVLRDQAFFKLQYFSGDRANDLGLVLIQEVKRFQGSSGIIFSHTVGKTLGN